MLFIPPFPKGFLKGGDFVNKKEGFRRYTMDKGDGFILPAADWFIDFMERRPRVAIGIGIGTLVLMTYGAKVDSERKEKECLPPSSCHEKIWKDARPGEEYPFKKPYFPAFGL